MNGILDLTKYLRNDPRIIDFNISMGEYRVELISRIIDFNGFYTNICKSIKK